MPPAKPYIACRIRDSLPDEVTRLDALLQANDGRPHAELAGRLLTEASCDLIDGFFGNAIRQMLVTEDDPGLHEAHAVVQEVKASLRHYLGWVTRFFSSRRLAPVVQYYQSLLVFLPTDDGLRPHMAFAVSPVLIRESEEALRRLRDPATVDVREGVEVLIRVIEAVLEPLLHEPKRRMRFNLVVDKTLDGIIVVTNALVFRSFRKLGTRLPPPLFPLVADHLEQFLYSD